MPQVVNKELTSLMKVLNEAEAKVECNFQSGKINAQREEQKYVWDEINEESLVPMSESSKSIGIDLTCQKSENNRLTTIDSNTNDDENERAFSIRGKIRKMKDEYDEKSEQLLQLKTTLARKKAATERKLKLIKDDWEKKFHIQASDHHKVRFIHSASIPI